MTLPPPNLMTSINDPRGPRMSPPPASERPSEQFSDALSRADNVHRTRQKHAADATDSPASRPAVNDRDTIKDDHHEGDLIDDQNAEPADVSSDNDNADPAETVNDAAKPGSENAAGDAHNSSDEAQTTTVTGDGTAPERAGDGVATHGVRQFLIDSSAAGGETPGQANLRTDANSRPIAVDAIAAEAAQHAASQATGAKAGHSTIDAAIAGRLEQHSGRSAGQSTTSQIVDATAAADAAPDNAKPIAAASPRSDSAARVAVESSSEPRPIISPALARAAEVDAAVRVEQTTGAAPTTIIDGSGSPARATVTASAFVEGATSERAAGDLPRLDQPQFAGRVLRGLSAMVNQRGGTMTMRLDPPELGALRIQMTITRGMVTAEFQASTPAAQRMLDQSMATLRTALEGQGLQVERLHVHQGAMQQHHGNDTSQHQSHADAGEGQSRGRGDGHSNPHHHSRSEALFDSIFEELQSGRRNATSQHSVGAAA